jgi:type VI secretion system secreted protein Hcp
MRNRSGQIHAAIPNWIRLSIAFILFAAALVSGASPAAAQGGKSPAGTRIFLTIEGMKQGKIKGEPGLGERILVLRVSYEVTAPRDMATGQASGKRQHGQVLVVKDWGAASPQLLQALAQNETLKSVLIEFFRTGAGGQEEATEIMRLTDATISKMKMTVSDASSGDGPAGRLIDEVYLTFRKIEITHPAAKTIFSDDWLAR